MEDFVYLIYQYHRDDRYTIHSSSVYLGHITFCILSLIIGVTFLTPVHARGKPAGELPILTGENHRGGRL
jgi:hypothetical protein